MDTPTPSLPPVCSYEGSDYQSSFWEAGERRYEDEVEAIALRRLSNRGGRLLLELGAGAGRNTPRYAQWERVVLLDYSRTQLLQARQRLGENQRYVYVTADIYQLPFVNDLFDGATMIRTLHHMANPVLALSNVQQALAANALFILEFANKRNLKSVARFLLRKQSWNPFDQDPVEFAALNFDFHPRYVRRLLAETGFKLEKQLSVSHFRAAWMKRRLPLGFLVALDSFLQPSGAWCQYSPSVFSRARVVKTERPAPDGDFFACPVCRHPLPEAHATQVCPGCGHTWEYRDGIYEFRPNPES